MAGPDRDVWAATAAIVAVPEAATFYRPGRTVALVIVRHAAGNGTGIDRETVLIRLAGRVRARQARVLLGGPTFHGRAVTSHVLTAVGIARGADPGIGGQAHAAAWGEGRQTGRIRGNIHGQVAFLGIRGCVRDQVRLAGCRRSVRAIGYRQIDGGIAFGRGHVGGVFPVEPGVLARLHVQALPSASEREDNGEKEPRAIHAHGKLECPLGIVTAHLNLFDDRSYANLAEESRQVSPSGSDGRRP